MEIFSALLVLCTGNSPVTGEFPSQRPVTRSFDVFFDLRLVKCSSKQWRRWWFVTPSRPLWRHRNVNRLSVCVNQRSRPFGFRDSFPNWLFAQVTCKSYHLTRVVVYKTGNYYSHDMHLSKSWQEGLDVYANFILFRASVTRPKPSACVCNSTEQHSIEWTLYSNITWCDISRLLMFGFGFKITHFKLIPKSVPIEHLPKQSWIELAL